MAFSGVHISYGEVFELGKTDVFRKAVWSETMMASGTTSSSASVSSSIRGGFKIRTTIDIYVSVGANPDASASPRDLILAGDPPTIIPCTYGDKLNWVAA